LAPLAPLPSLPLATLPSWLSPFTNLINNGGGYWYWENGVRRYVPFSSLFASAGLSAGVNLGPVTAPLAPVTPLAPLAPLPAVTTSVGPVTGGTITGPRFVGPRVVGQPVVTGIFTTVGAPMTTVGSPVVGPPMFP
jgi:hypothetical protein